MTDPRTASGGPQRPRPDAELAADLRSLRRETERDLASMDSVLRTVSRPPRTMEERLMTVLGTMSRRPWIPASLVGALAVITLLVVPFSYERTAGQRVALTLKGGALDDAHVRGIAQQLKQVLHADGVAVEATAGADGAMALTLSATAPVSAHVDAAATAAAFRARLAALGYDATTTVAPVRERVTGSMVAYAMDRMVAVDIDGKSAAQIEDEIRRGLASAGVENPQVSVERSTSDGHDQLKVQVEAKRTSAEPGTGPEPTPEIVLRKDGAPIEGEGLTVRQELRRSATDGTTLTMTVTDGPKSATITVPHSDTIGDAAIEAAVRSQFAAAGITADITVSNGRVRVHRAP